MALRLRKYPDPVLRQNAAPVTVFDEKLRALVDAMIPIMIIADGMGLAAPQVGESLRLVIIDSDPKSEERHIITLINPVIKKYGQGKETCDEGCLSLPGLSFPISRALQVTVEAQNLTGKTFTIEAEGLLARCIQHELDHLDGRLALDRASSARRNALREQLANLENQYQVENKNEPALDKVVSLDPEGQK